MSTQTAWTNEQQAAVVTRAQANGEPQWMQDLRVAALAKAGELAWPVLEKMKMDRWALGELSNVTTSSPIQSVEELPEVVHALLPSLDGNLVIQRNSSVVFAHLSDAAKTAGVVVCSLQDALQTHGELVKNYFAQAVAVDEHRLSALHYAFWNGGIFVYVPRNVELAEPIQALFVSDDASASFAPHVLIVAESHSKVTYVENVASATEGTAFTQNGVVEIFAKNGAAVRYASIHQLGDASVDVNYRRAIVENDANVEWILGEMSDGNGISDTHSLLRGNGSNTDMKVITVGTKSQKWNISTRAQHFGKSSTSQMLTRAVMKDDATAIINGITKIEKGATGANGEQTEKVLMLSPSARGDANPILLIDEDDVKAGHAASVGQLNPEQLYYLKSRGIPLSQALKLLTYGFLAPIVDEIPLEVLHDQLQALVERKLNA
jgi:Fe-S cluster assembly protein SufD